MLKCWQIGLICPSALGTDQFLMLWCLTTQLLGTACSSQGMTHRLFHLGAFHWPWPWNRSDRYHWRDNGRLEFLILKTVFLLYLAIHVVLHIISCNHSEFPIQVIPGLSRLDLLDCSYIWHGTLTGIEIRQVCGVKSSFSTFPGESPSHQSG